VGDLLAHTMQPPRRRVLCSVAAPPARPHNLALGGAYFWDRYCFMRSNEAALDGMTRFASAIISASKYALSFTDARASRRLSRLLEAMVAGFNDAARPSHRQCDAPRSTAA
jgi:hypothetical protein